ncbi:hypothetical protein [Rhizobium leguminosarum]|uniref:hypothetical protein n=1 Tax=Rhizobium leguminosarum TaxID=384 RepID=UPI001C925180|nr:hypothetical protein [Rhizobium leguminosarum]MBY2914148.1 hypothetical protein [Rhizobium leguminosarum]MBY2969687.1 hypothetical protein [Rhizobium leguminosarum]MBY2977060.1 hypothetical protein [Rhizobium leguminosarum]MBY3005610.1 hypothetical protein [Rhizobium leguminosarum]
MPSFTLPLMLSVGLYIIMSKNRPIHSPSSKAIARSYSDWFETTIESFLDRNRLPFQPYDAYVEANAFFVTFTFDKRKLARRKSRLSVSEATIVTVQRELGGSKRRQLSAEFDNVDRVYKEVCQALLGSNFHRPSRRKFQPLMIAAADVNGTRYWKSCGPIENFHIHSIWVFGNGQRGAFRQKIDEICNDVDDRYDFDEINVCGVSKTDRNRKIDVGKLSSYSSKFLGFNTIDLSVPDDLEIYPQRQS